MNIEYGLGDEFTERASKTGWFGITNLNKNSNGYFGKGWTPNQRWRKYDLTIKEHRANWSLSYNFVTDEECCSSKKDQATETLTLKGTDKDKTYGK